MNSRPTEQPARKRNVPDLPPPALMTPKYDDYDIRAVRSLFEGKASEGQQLAVVAFLIRASALYDASFNTGADGDRLTAFAEGRRFVGSQLVKLSKIPTSDAKVGQ